MVRIGVLVICCFFCAVSITYAQEKELKEFEGVVTMANFPAKLIQLKEIIKDPKPGTSYIGEKGVIVEVETLPDVMINWTILNVEYYKYQNPKIIKYELFGEEKQVSVENKAVSIEKVGCLSLFVKQDDMNC